MILSALGGTNLPSALSAQCVSCHRDEAARKDLAHQGYTSCSNCHSPNFWTPQGAGTPYALNRESVCR